MVIGLIAGFVFAVLIIAAFLYVRGYFRFERIRGQKDMLKNYDREEMTLLSIGDAVITTDKSGNVDHMNSIAEKLTEWEIGSARGHPVQSIFKIVDEDSPSLVLDPVNQCIKEGKVVRLVKPVCLRGRMTHQSEIEAMVSPTRDRKGRITGTVLVFHDIGKVREMQDHIDYQASHDSLTGLIDRREFEKCLKMALDTAHKEGRHHALCYMDIDQFRVVNESFGHEAGDELLIQLSALLLTTVRDDDTLGRLGGDEYGLLLKDCPIEEASNKADLIRKIVEEFRFVWQGKTFDVGFGIGVVAIGPNSGSVNEILKAADAACYAAKSRGRHQTVVYQADDPELKKRRGEMRWATRISDALRNQEFRLYYQEIQPVHGESSRGFHCELLMRSEDSKKGLVSPEQFLPAAERYNLMSDIDRWVVASAIPQIASLDKVKSHTDDNLFGINLSGQSLSDESFYDYVKELFMAHDVNPKTICFEVTETSAIVNLDIALDFIQKIKSLGCKFALDDFGTGVSSYSYLKKFPFDYVKIDGSFIRNISTNPVDAVMVESVCRIAKVMGIKTIAEFVEEESVLEKLREMGVDFAQGYGIAKPAPLKDWINGQVASGSDDAIDKLAN